MKKANIDGKGNLRRVNGDWFTGKTWMRSISDIIQSKGHDMYHVHFESGSRTKLHTHNGNQILIAMRGRGSLEVFEKTDDAKPAERDAKGGFSIKKTQTVRLLKGDVVHIPSGTFHTHGSVDAAAEFSHIAINILPKKNTTYKTVWYDSDFRRTVYNVV